MDEQDQILHTFITDTEAKQKRLGKTFLLILLTSLILGFCLLAYSILGVRERLAQINELDGQIKSRQEENARLEKRNEELSSSVANLRDEVESLNTQKRNVAEQTEQLIGALSAAPPTTLDRSVKAAAKSAENSLFSVALYGYEVDQREFDLAKSYLMDNGYTLISDSILSSRPQWLASRPTVLYYDDKSEKAARALAEELTKRTGKTFGFAKGAGLGVPESQRERSLRIHIMN